MCIGETGKGWGEGFGSGMVGGGAGSGFYTMQVATLTRAPGLLWVKDVSAFRAS